MPADEEVELKFLSDPETWQSLQTQPPLGDLPRDGQQFVRTRYFDTPDYKLRRNGIHFRVRQSGDALLQSVKQIGGVTRDEWENELTEPLPDPSLLAGRQVAPILKNKALLDQLQPIFETDIHRLSLLWRRDGVAIEISFDKGEIKAKDNELHLREIELELKQGEVAELFAFAQRLVASAPITLSFVSKGDRGFLLSEGKWGQPQKVEIPRLSRDIGAGTAFKRICHACLHAFMLNTSLFDVTTTDIEIVHQSRVALRRLRAAMSFFAPIAEGQRYETLRNELAWMSDLLGAARDLDVWQSDTFRPKATQEDGHPGFALLAHHMEGLRLQAYARLAEGLASERWRRTLLESAIWLQLEDWKLAERAAALAEFLDTRLTDRIARILKEGDKLDAMDEPAKHQLRIRAKKLRYTLEFFDGCAEGSRSRKHFKRLTEACETMQEALGEIHDRVALEDFLAAEFTKIDAQSASPQLVPAAFAAGLLAREKPDHTKPLRDAHRAYEKLKDWQAFWR